MSDRLTIGVTGGNRSKESIAKQLQSGFQEQSLVSIEPGELTDFLEDIIIDCIIVSSTESNPVKTVEKIRKRTTDLPVLVLCSSLTDQRVRELYNNGVTACLPSQDNQENKALVSRLDHILDLDTGSNRAEEIVFEAFESSPIEVTVVDCGGEIMYSNTVARELPIKDTEQHTISEGDNYLQLWGQSESGTSDTIRGGIKDVLDGSRQRFMHDYPVSESDETQWVMLHVSSMTQNGQRYGVIRHFDMTQPKQRLKVLNRIIRHDMANKLNIVNGYAESLRRAVEIGEEGDVAVSKINNATDSILELSQKIREVDSALDGTVQSSVPLNEAVENSVRRVCSQNQEAEISVNMPESMCVYAGATLENALYELLENSVKHSSQEPPVVSIVVEETNGVVTIQIEDNGPGLTTRQKQLLNREQQITQVEHATGLGLWFVLWLVDRFDGSLEFEEREDEGLRVTMQLEAASCGESENEV